MTNQTKSHRRFTAQHKQEAIDISLQQGLFCYAVAERLGLPSSSLAGGVRQVRIDRGKTGQGCRR